jgi:hypothetical protein
MSRNKTKRMGSRAYGVKVFIGVSEYGLKRRAWYARVAHILAEHLDCELITFPGQHGSFLDMPNSRLHCAMSSAGQ